MMIHPQCWPRAPHQQNPALTVIIPVDNDVQMPCGHYVRYSGDIKSSNSTQFTDILA